MRCLRWLPLVLLAGAAWSADPTPSAPTAPTAADAVTQRRAAEAAKAYAETSAPTAPLDPALAERIGEIEMLATEGESFLAAGRDLKAGDCALAAAERWTRVSLAERATLGARGRAAQAKITALNRALAGPDGLVVPAPLTEAKPAD